MKKNRLIAKNISIAFIVLFFFSVFTFFYVGNINRVLEYETNDIITVTIAGWIILSFLFLGIIIYILYSKANSQKTIEKVAYTDFVTGYSNWRKFELDVTNLLKKTSQNNKYAMVDVYKRQPIDGTELTVLGLVGDTSKIDAKRIEANKVVEKVMHVVEPFKKANRKFHPEPSIINVNGDVYKRQLLGFVIYLNKQKKKLHV